ncbi:conserved hypothetical protein [Candidatus Sulfobium mesophilum]|uniref:Uncharacterized protein n=1 Tax=Candidatus Sulfobium mesophilum TaxID=2016548 RepID=A0A2U3QIH9_9BACT|nr:conserved hypothetical protein [Candidatus Sulfobium mesophilum]
MMEKEEKDIRDRDLEIIEGEFININQSTVRNVEGGHVEMQQVGALSVDGEKIEATQCASALTHGDEIFFNQSISTVTIGNNTTVNYSFSPVSLSRYETTLNRSAAGLVAAGSVKADNSVALMVLANKVEGELTTLLDWKSAVAIGAVVGGVWGLLSLLRRK